MATKPLHTPPEPANYERVPPERTRKSPREAPIDAIGGTFDEDPESGEGGSTDQFDAAMPECYSEPEILSYAGTVDWEIIFEQAGVPEWYRPAWRQLVGDDATTVRDIPDAHYRWIIRACRGGKWRARLLASISAQRALDPLFGVPRPRWNNQAERNRSLYHIGWQPIAQCGVSTLCRAASSSTTLYWKVGDKPGDLTRDKKHRTLRRTVVSCEGFRANFQSVRLDENRQFANDCLRYGATGVIREYDLPPGDNVSVLRHFHRVEKPKRALTSAEHWQRTKNVLNPQGGGPHQPPPCTPEEWRAQLVENYPGKVSPTYYPHNNALLDYIYRRDLSLRV
jgi:hypothetical protein